MIDLKKLREVSNNAVVKFGSDAVQEVSASTVLELLDMLSAAQKDAARLDWLEASRESHGFCHTEYGEYRYYAHQVSGCRTVRQLIDTAMQS